MFRKISDTFLAAPQISIADVAAAKSQGVTIIINNRPDGEEPDAPQSDEIEAAAKAVGMDYAAIAVTHAGYSHPQIDAMIAALAQAEGGKALAYCRSGTRSTMLWALAQAKSGMHPAEIAARAESAGYDVSPIAAMLDLLWGQRDQ
jgi:uncharacterized protein (TIGR01244 family)